MKVLFAKTFGLGNAVMSVPAIKALVHLGHDVTVLHGSGPDDVGASEVFEHLKQMIPIRVLTDARGERYDLAILSIPYDGRWVNGVHFEADRVMDGRTRPDPNTQGLVSWKKHEVEYQMDNAVELCYAAAIPDCSFLPEQFNPKPKSIYLGLGYKKDAAGFWKIKHWGNENYISLVRKLIAADPEVTIWTTGDARDYQDSVLPILRGVGDGRFRYVAGPIRDSFRVLERCHVYVGNDTGMMHVAASFGMPTLGMFFLENSITKNRPWCDSYRAIDGSNRIVTPEEILKEVKDMLGI